jgi:GNAT superfamily N-acetyltransferase
MNHLSAKPSLVTQENDKPKFVEQEWRHGEFVISTDRSRLNIPFIHEFFSNESYWATNRSREVVERSIENSLNFGVFYGDEQIGFARVVTDYATFAWLADVFIIDAYRNRGLGKWLVEVITSHPRLQNFRRWLLATRDAHELYRRVGFNELAEPTRWMERRND